MLRKYGELKRINCRTMDKITQGTSYLFVWGVKRGCVGVVGVVTGTSAPQATCRCAYQQVTKRTTNPHSCKIQ